jgi:hypothetical protein
MFRSGILPIDKNQSIHATLVVDDANKHGTAIVSLLNLYLRGQ